MDGDREVFIHFCLWQYITGIQVKQEKVYQYNEKTHKILIPLVNFL